MIKKIRTIFEKYMIRPMLYQCATKISIALVLCLLWDRFINREQYYSLVEFAFFVAGAFFLALAWFQYLRLDGPQFHHLLEEKKEKKKKKQHFTKDIVDFADEKIISFSELSDEERVVCRFLGDLLCAALFLIPAGIALVF
mgnify:FL=1